MPQIWLSCEELAEILDIEPAMVRYQAKASRRDVKLDQDGTTWILLSPVMADEYLRIRLERAAADPGESAASVEVDDTPPADEEDATVGVAPAESRVPAAVSPPSNVTLWNRYRKSIPTAGAVLSFVRAKASA